MVDIERFPGNVVVMHNHTGVESCVAPCPVAQLDLLAERYNTFYDSPWVFAPRPSETERHGGTKHLVLPEGAVNSRVRFPQDWKAEGTLPSSGGRNYHMTSKSIGLMEHFVKLVTPPKEIVLDPFAGSGSTIIGANLAGIKSIGIEIDKDYCTLAEARIAYFSLMGSMTRYVINQDAAVALGCMRRDYFGSMVTDPPAGIFLAGVEWDSDKGGKNKWTAWLSSIFSKAFYVLKPGAYTVVWAFPKTIHWTITALEESGFKICTIIPVLNGTPPVTKGRNIDNIEVSETFNEEWTGYNTQLKSSSDVWILAQKPISEKNIVENLKKWGVGALNIDAARTRILSTKVPEIGLDEAW